jgi:hypothetical protein
MEVFQRVLEIVLTGLSTSIFILLAAKYGLLPILYLSQTPMEEVNKEDEGE